MSWLRFYICSIGSTKILFALTLFFNFYFGSTIIKSIVDCNCAYLKYGHPRIEFQLTATALISNTVNPESNSSWPPQRLSRIRSSPNRTTVDRHSAYLEYGHPRIEFQLTATVLISYTVTSNHIISSLVRAWRIIPAIWCWNISNVILFTSQE